MRFSHWTVMICCIFKRFIISFPLPTPAPAPGSPPTISCKDYGEIVRNCSHWLKVDSTITCKNLETLGFNCSGCDCNRVSMATATAASLEPTPIIPVNPSAPVPCRYC